MTEFETALGYRFSSRELLEEALRHGSLLSSGAGERSYQRLEYLGDAVLNLCLAEATYRKLPEAGEGELSKARSALISNRSLVRVGERIGIADALHTDPSVRKRGGGVTRKMIADAVEALAGAIFLDGGFEAAQAFVLAHFRDEEWLEEVAAGFDSKSRLQEWCQKMRVPLPRYQLLSADGPAHARTFRVRAALSDGRHAEGTGKTKKEAGMAAASSLLAALAEPGGAG
ncbi:MAG: ribonuclease III [Gemmatimonadota bacterium]